MTITRTEERPAHHEESERIPPDAASAAPPVRTGWMTRFAWAKTVGGW